MLWHANSLCPGSLDFPGFYWDWVLKFSNKEAREKMHTASLMAGFTFTNTALGLVHSTAHQIGAEYRIPHGRANAVMLPYVVQYNTPAAAARYANIARAFGYDSTDPYEGTAKFIKAIRDLQKLLGIPACLKDAGIDEQDFLNKVDMLAQNAMKDGSTPANPRVPTVEEIKKIFLCAYYGNDVL